jgi:hypothetical protein
MRLLSYREQAVKFYCECAEKYGTLWIQLEPGDRHAFRVVCAHCEKYVKWGAARELMDLQDAHAVVYVRWFSGKTDPTD